MAEREIQINVLVETDLTLGEAEQIITDAILDTDGDNFDLQGIVIHTRVDEPGLVDDRDPSTSVRAILANVEGNRRKH